MHHDAVHHDAVHHDDPPCFCSTLVLTCGFLPSFAVRFVQGQGKLGVPGKETVGTAAFVGGVLGAYVLGVPGAAMGAGAFMYATAQGVRSCHGCKGAAVRTGMQAYCLLPSPSLFSYLSMYIQTKHVARVCPQAFAHCLYASVCLLVCV